MSKASPIQSKINCVIIWTRKIKLTVEMYSKLFDLSAEQQNDYGHLVVLHLPSGVDIMIDSNGMVNQPIPEKAPPLFFIPATDIDEAAAFIQELGFTMIYGDIQRLGSVSFFNMRDPDFNVITVCQNH
jgi:predicted enzyme related to lactoylglutathione lyase